MDDYAHARLVLGLPVQLPASAHGLHQLLLTMGPSGIAAAGEILTRSDALSSCSLQPLSVSLEEATSSIARALFLSTDSIAYSCSASHGVILVLSTISDVAPEGSISPRRTAFNRLFRCFASTVLDTAQALGLTTYFPDFNGTAADHTLFTEVLSSFTPFAEMEPEGGHWAAAGVNTQTDITAYPLLLKRYRAVPLLLATKARGIFQQIAESIIWDNRILDRTLFNESLEGIIRQQDSETIRIAKRVMFESDPDFSRNLPDVVTRYYTFVCIAMVVRAGFAGVEALIRASMPAVLPDVAIDACPHQGGRYGATQETATRIIAAGPRSLAGSNDP